MDTDYAVPMEVDRIRARVFKIMDTDAGSEEVQTWVSVFSVSDDASGEPGVHGLPATFGILPDDSDLNRQIVIELEALANGGDQALVSRRVKTGFVKGENRLVRVLLYRACAGVSCSAGETCGCGGALSCTAPSCIDETVRPEDLESIDDPGVLPPDAGMPILDGGVPDGSLPPDDAGTDLDAAVPDGGGINCGAPLTLCGLDCVNTQADPRYCGDCDTACAIGHICDAGNCMDPGDCRTNGVGCSGVTYCDGATGECLPGCTESEQCIGGNQVCDLGIHDCICAPGFEPCAAGCVDTNIDPRFCGDCTTSCPLGHVCQVGICLDAGDCRTNGVGCSGFTYCDGATGDCLPGCGGDNQCTGGNQVCDLGIHDCVCAPGFEPCAAGCVDANIDPRFCGDCTTSCPLGHVCQVGVCLDPNDCRTNGVGCSGLTYCDDATGDCLPGCGGDNQCTGANEECDTPTHQCVCAAGFHRCGNVCVSDLDVNFCGTSCAPCPSPPNSTPICNLGVCDFVCDATFEQCDEMCCPTS